jgi:hypothetical protein
VSIRLLNRHTRDPSRSCISRSTSQSHSLSDSISQRASLFTHHLVRAGYSPVPSSRFTRITWKTLVSLPTDYANSGSGSEHRIVTYAELATAPIQLTSSRACHRHVTLSNDMLANHISESATDSLRLSPAPSSLSSHLHFMSESMTMTSSPEPTARIITRFVQSSPTSHVTPSELLT